MSHESRRNLMWCPTQRCAGRKFFFFFLLNWSETFLQAFVFWKQTSDSLNFCFLHWQKFLQLWERTVTDFVFLLDHSLTGKSVLQTMCNIWNANVTFCWTAWHKQKVFDKTGVLGGKVWFWSGSFVHLTTGKHPDSWPLN